MSRVGIRCHALGSTRTTLSVLLRAPREVALQLDGHLGDGLEDPIAVAALLEVVVEVPVHQLPEGLRRDLLHFPAADDGVCPAGGRHVDQDGRGSLALGELPLLKEDASAGLGVFGSPLVNGEPDPRPGVPARLGQGGRDLLALGHR